jgi:predicted nucleotidyltransferase
MATKSIVELLQKYIQLLKREGIVIDKAYLYGSYATKSQTEESDIDLMLVSSQFDKSDDILYGKIWSLTRKVSSKIEPYIVGLGKFESDDISPIIQIVKKEGLEIVC